jgi:hypothetical protein
MSELCASRARDAYIYRSVEPRAKTVVEFTFNIIMTDCRNIYPLCEIAGFTRKVREMCDLLICSAVCTGISLRTFRPHLQGSRIQDSSVSNSHSALRNIPEEHRSRSVDGIFLSICSIRKHVCMAV